MAKLSSNYAAALYELLAEDGNPEAAFEQASVLRDALKVPDCRRILVHPHIPAAEKREFFKKAFGGSISPHLLSFICLTIDKSREAHAIPALNELLTLLSKRLNRAAAKVVSAEPLSPEQLAKLKTLLEGKLQKTVELNTQTDPAAIGGARIKTDAYFIDRTIKRRLTELKERCGA